MKFNFHKKNNGSICHWQGVNEIFMPKREPDKVTISYKKIVSFYPDSEFPAWERDEKTGEIIAVYLEYGDDAERWVLVSTFVGSEGDTGYVFGLEDSRKESKYWYTLFGVYRLSDHWGSVGKSNWTIDEGASLGYANYSSFISK